MNDASEDNQHSKVLDKRLIAFIDRVQKLVHPIPYGMCAKDDEKYLEVRVEVYGH